MKKLFLAAAFAVFGMGLSQAQVVTGNSLITAKIGFGGNYVGGGAKAGLPMGLQYEYQLNDKFRLGASLDYQSTKLANAWAGKDWKWTLLFASVVGNYVFVNDAKYDAYVGAKLGYVNVSFDDGGSGLPSTSSSGVGYGGHVGGHYWFTNSLGLNAEVGYSSFSIANVGLTFKL